MKKIKNIIIILILIIIVIICILIVKPKNYKEHLYVPGISEVAEAVGIGGGSSGGSSSGSVNLGLAGIPKKIEKLAKNIDLLSVDIDNLWTLGGNTESNLHIAEYQILLRMQEDMKSAQDKLLTWSKSSKIFTDILECYMKQLNDNVKALITDFFADIPSIYNNSKDDNTNINATFQINKTRLIHLFEKCTSLIESFKILRLCSNDHWSKVPWIANYIFNTLLIDTWKYCQYNIKYNTIELLSTEPSLKDIFNKKSYNEKFEKIILSVINILYNGLIFLNDSLPLSYVLINYLQMTFRVLDYFDKTIMGTLDPIGELSYASGGPKGLARIIREDIDATIHSASFFTGLKTINADQLAAQKQQIDKTKIIIDTLIAISNDAQRNMKNTLGATILNFNNKNSSLCPKVLIPESSEYSHIIFNKDLTDKISNVNSMISDAQQRSQFNLFDLAIKTSIPHGWSYKKNKDDFIARVTYVPTLSTTTTPST